MFDSLSADPALADWIAAEPIYKGATRPPSIFGVPLLAFLLVAGGCFLAAMYLLVYVSAAATAPVAVGALALLFAMRAMTRKDDQRLRQAYLSLKLGLLCPNRHFWRCRSYAPLSLRGACDAWRR
jgi:type IV secretion system protein VirB3